MISLSPVQLAVACATMTLLAAHVISPAARTTTTCWALGALVFWLTGASLWTWLFQDTTLRHPVWSGHLWSTGVAPAGGLIALLVWTLWYCRQRPTLRQRLCLLIMITNGLWWGLEQYRSGLQTPLPDTLAALTLKSLEGRSITPAHDAPARHLLLWRSDCTPCRQWLQKLADLPAGQRPELALVNQGEPLLSVIRYLDQHPDHQLELEDTALLLDPRQHLLALTGSRRLPVLLQVGPDSALRRVDDLPALIASSPR
ncbi:hypothetical protein C8D72_2293 [Kushneria indalinina DSM 14324]|uniref:Thiol-disulfide isomerase/thioredoxin n=2 Tax=Kushneria indalinina TaxID=184067 RepID=A0A3D9DT26_9GAMM|nr:hypothetical protein C8D72_2293 [Kushneria indalinina DSM 14324]